MKPIFNKLLIFALTLSFTGCGYSERIDPLYTKKPIKFETITIKVDSKIEPTVIQPTAVRKWINRVLGGLIGDVVEIPLDLSTVIFTKLPFEDKLKLPTDGPWTDPSILPYITSFRVTKAYLEITPEEERGPEYEPRHCFWIFGKCGENLSFLTEMYVNVGFKNTTDDTVASGAITSKPPQDDDSSDDEDDDVNTFIQLAAATKKANYDKKAKRLTFDMTNIDLIPYIKAFGSDMSVKIHAKGSIPKKATYVRGGVSLEVTLQLPSFY